MSDACPDRTEIVDPGKEDRAEDHPEKRREPAPDDRDSRTDDGSGPGNRREVVAPQHEAIRRDVVDVVPHRMGRGLEVRVELIDFLRDELRVEAVSKEDGRDANDGEDCSVQGAPP